MHLTNTVLFEAFIRKFPDSQTALERWAQIVEQAQWKNLNELKNDFLSTDYVGNNRYVFNIRGNKYRLIVVIVFFAGSVDIRFVGTHKEYDKVNVKNI